MSRILHFHPLPKLYGNYRSRISHRLLSDCALVFKFVVLVLNDLALSGYIIQINQGENDGKPTPL
jgi:hypothetical protein